MKQTIAYDSLKQLATYNGETHLNCLSGLLALCKIGREDIIYAISKLRRSDYDKFTPELIADHMKNFDKFIERFDKMYNKKTIKAEIKEAEYLRKKYAYDFGESEENPDA